MKKIRLSLCLFTFLLLLCSCLKEPINNLSSDTKNHTVDITLNESEHPELRLESVNGEYAVRDFAVDNGEIYILQEDDTVLRYDQNGTFLEKQVLNLSEQGLTASRIAHGNDALYLLDGHNNAVITVKNGEVSNVSVLNFSDVGMIKNFYATENGTLFLSFADTEEAYSVEIDPTEAETKRIGEKQRGYLIGKNVTYLPEVIDDDNGTSRLKATLFESGEKTEEFYIGSTEKSRTVIGLSLYGLSDGNWFGILHEFVNEGENPDDEQYVQTFVNINPKDGKIKTSDRCLDDRDIVKLSKDDTYCMSLSDKTLTVKPIRAFFSNWTESDLYFLTKN